jgi:putative SOS response-associated peptidase YedK
MCGRYTLASNVGELIERFGFHGPELTYLPSYNIAPSQTVLTVVGGTDRRVSMMRWGLVPCWSKSLSPGSTLINARAETIDTRSTFKHAFKQQRCLILADGFFEWKKETGTKIPMRIALKSKQPFAFAGLWKRWTSPENKMVESCAIITCQSNQLVKPIHNRMPVILTEDAEAIWLDHDGVTPADLKDVLVPYPTEPMEAYQVSPVVNSPQNNHSGCIQPYMKCTTQSLQLI